ncbi:hypothetical protein [Natronospira bacteriovora]|uniref:Chromosome partition protein Smc n=1 Tax=Natronospira bacteriovora TaxID=3069753 RepID=A0ABU0W7Y5_9GAMM|nr:hypothetical protein [Natronospira sp. AB-CW4]MDQ2070152.1 hypothetical protein [Natronospira sp. AB-CW4]
MYLILGATPGSNWQAVIPMLEQLGATALDGNAVARWRANPAGRIGPASSSADTVSLLPVGEAITDMDLAQQLAKTKDARALLLHTRPETALARAMQAGKNPTEELDAWRQAVEAFLQAYRRNRRSIRLINADTALQAPEAFAHACQEHLGLSEADIQPPASNDGQLQSVYRLLAAQMVAQAEDIQPLLAELEASSIPLAEESQAPQLDCQAIYEELTASETQFEKLKDQTTTQSSELKEENELILLQTHQLQEELEKYYLDLQKEAKSRQEAETECDRLKAELESVKQGQDAVSIREKELKEENELLLLQLHQVQEELESYYLELQDEVGKRKAQEEKLAARDQTIKNKNWAIDKKEEKYQGMLAQKKRLDRELTRIREKNTAIQNSLSWKVTKPLRAIRRLTMRKPRKAGAV